MARDGAIPSPARRLRQISWLLLVAWTGGMAVSLAWNLREQDQKIRSLARNAAEINFENDILYRRWASQHGGVYVPQSALVPPNPYLHVPNRDVTTTSGVALTLVNPAYMTRMVNEMGRKPGGSRSHITSLKPIRPENRPDPWEEAALRAFETGQCEVSSVEQIDGVEYVRFMRPFVTEATCLHCHAAQGYREGDVRGGISVSVPTAPLRAIQRPVMLRGSLVHLGVWLAGVVGIVVSRRSLAGQIASGEKIRIALQRSEEGARASLREKEILLKEIHHRVKNNMQVISSLVSLQADALPDDSLRQVLRNVTDRVRSMALVHEKLYQSAELARIDFAEYAKSLLQHLWRAHGAAVPGVRLALELEPVWLDVEAAVPCGLVLNELVSNALKHAFRDGAEGEVAVALRRNADGRVHLEVRDNGVGMPPGPDRGQARSLGLHLVDMLSGQLDAAVEVRTGAGTAFQVTFDDTDTPDNA